MSIDVLSDTATHAYREGCEHRYSALLLDYVTGALPVGPAFVVSAHLNIRPDARKQTQIMTAMGGALLDAIEPVEIARPDWLQHDNSAFEAGVSFDRHPSVAGVLASIDQGRWKRNLAGMLVKPIAGTTAQLLKLEAGRKVPEHGHSGLELTLVLSGALDDGLGVYKRGDLLVHDEDSSHEPGAMPGNDCICMIAQTGSVRLNGPLGWLISKFS